MPRPFKRIGVIGAGTMGAGIAQVCAIAGLQTVLYDPDSDGLSRAWSRIAADVETAVAKRKLPADASETVTQQLKLESEWLDVPQDLDLVIEAVPETLELKRDIFRQLDAHCEPHTVLASNTSSLSVAFMAAATNRPEQVAGLHFFNPVPRMSLVEVVATPMTAPGLPARLAEFVRALGKTPVQAQDTPGFIVNRVARSFYGEALRLKADQVADVATLDAIVREEGGFAMGPFQLMDLIGIDVNTAVTRSVYEAFGNEPRFAPHPIQAQMVAAGHLGRKTGQGFYPYD